MWVWLNTNADIAGVIIGAIGLAPVLWAVWRNLQLRNEERRHRRFSTYHDLIKQLVEPEAPGKPLKLDRQIAIIFELRNFPEYYEITVRILNGLYDFWKDSDPRLLAEIKLTIQFTQSCHCWCCR